MNVQAGASEVRYHVKVIDKTLLYFIIFVLKTDFCCFSNYKRVFFFNSLYMKPTNQNSGQ